MRTAFAIMAVALVGCSQNPAPAPHPPPSAPVAGEAAPQSSVSTVIDGLTGKTAVEAGKRARIQLEKIGAQEQHDINEAMQP